MKFGHGLPRGFPAASRGVSLVQQGRDAGICQRLALLLLLSGFLHDLGINHLLGDLSAFGLPSVYSFRSLVFGPTSRSPGTFSASSSGV